MGTALTTDLAGKTDVVISLEGKKALDLAATLDELKISSGIDWTFGTGANQVNLLWHDKRTLADGANETIAIYSGATEKNAFGDLLTMEAIKFLYIKNKSADATLKILGTAVTAIPICSDPSDIIEIPPGGMFLWTCPTAAGIVTTTNENLKLEHDGTGSDTMDIEIVVMGLD